MVIRGDKWADSNLCIIDPFERERNLGHVCQSKHQIIIEEFRLAHQNLSQGHNLNYLMNSN